MGERSAARPDCTLPPGNTRYRCYGRLGGPQGPSGRAENSSYGIRFKICFKPHVTVKVKVKVKCSRHMLGVAHTVGRGIALLFHDRGTRSWVSGQQHAPAALNPRERPGTHFTGGWVGPRAGLDEQKISSPPGFNPGFSSPKSVAIPTELPGPPTK